MSLGASPLGASSLNALSLGAVSFGSGIRAVTTFSRLNMHLVVAGSPVSILVLFHNLSALSVNSKMKALHLPTENPSMWSSIPIATSYINSVSFAQPLFLFLCASHPQNQPSGRRFLLSS